MVLVNSASAASHSSTISSDSFQEETHIIRDSRIWSKFRWKWSMPVTLPCPTNLLMRMRKHSLRSNSSCSVSNIKQCINAAAHGGKSRKDEPSFIEQHVELIKKDQTDQKYGKHKYEDKKRDDERKSESYDSMFSSKYHDFINFGEEDEMEIVGYKKSNIKSIFTWVMILATLGLLRLVFHWWPRFMLFSTHTKCSISEADAILITEIYQQKHTRYHVKNVQTARAELLRTSNLFAEVGFTQEQNSSRITWDQRLEEELQRVNSPKLVIPKYNGKVQETEVVRYFCVKKLKYIWDEQYSSYVKLCGFDKNISCSALHASKGLSIFEQCQRRLVYGNNEIQVKVNTIFQLIFREILNPFYVFQICSVILWLSDGYIYFSIAIIFMSVIGIASAVYQTRKNQHKLRCTVQGSDLVTVCREDNAFETIPTEHLVPGDLVVIPAYGCTMQFDAALLTGNCIVNESMLTGESVPVTKISLPNRENIPYDGKEHARNTLYCGTQVLQARYYGNEKVFAVVLRTGFLTSKGSLVRSIMYPPPVDYKFERDSYKFVAALAGIAGIGFIYSIYLKLEQGETIRDIIVDSLDLITIVVPPALPAAMTVGRLYAQRRLQKKAIYCISPRAINVSGSINCVCFDKTGTLTEEGLDLWGAVPTEVAFNSSKYLSQEEMDGSRAVNKFYGSIQHAEDLEPGSMLTGMSVCHSLTLIDNEIVGDPLDVKMFEWTGCSLEEPTVTDFEKFDGITSTIIHQRKIKNHDRLNGNFQDDSGNVGSHDVGIVRIFPFSSSLQRMSVIVKSSQEQQLEIFCKGSPEKMASLSRPETVPEDFSRVLEQYAQQGYRVIALCSKKLPINYTKVQRVLREEVEMDLTFLGLIVLENRLKPETKGVISALKTADMRTIMVTGDNMLTAISVARECNIVESTQRVIVLSTDADCGKELDPRKDDEDGEIKKPQIRFADANKVEQSADLGRPQSPVSQQTIVSNISGGSMSSPARSISMDGSKSNEIVINMDNLDCQDYVLAMTGKSFSVVNTFYPELIPRVLVRGAIFGRMSPEQKQQLVELLQSIGYFVGMCGDGANDCGALKAAHTGVSLSDTEASVASPFTSVEPNITCIPKIIKEGRCALITSFGIFKYMAVYSLTQFLSVIMLYTIGANLTDMQFLYIDLFLISVFALYFGRTKPFSGPLVKQPPSASLVSAPPIVSIICHMIVIIFIQVIAFEYVQKQDWFTPFIPNPEDKYACYENYAVFAVSSFQYIIMAVVFSQGKPYRKTIISNPGLLSSLVFMTTLTLYLLLYPSEWFKNIMELLVPDDLKFKLIMIALAICNLMIAIVIEHGIVNSILAKKFSYKSEQEKKPYVQLEKQLKKDSAWPPVNNDKSFQLSNTPTKDDHFSSNDFVKQENTTLILPVSS